MDFPEPPARRNRFGWFTLAVLFGLLIAIQAAMYLDRPATVPLAKFEDRLRTISAQQKVSSANVSPDAVSSVAADLDKERATDINAERLWIITTYEAKGQVPQADVQRLKRSALDDSSTLSEIYDSKTLTPTRARKLVSDLKDDLRSSTLLARDHALEKAGIKSGRTTFGKSFSVAVSAGLAMVVFAGAVLWVLFLIAKLGGSFPASGHSAEPLTEPQADAFALRGAQMLLCFIAVPFATLLLIPKSARTFGQVITEVAILVAVYFLSRSPVDGERISLRRIGFRKDHLGWDVLFGVAASFMNFPLVLLVTAASNWLFKGLPQAQHPIQVELASGLTPVAIAGILFSASIAAPLFEEALFRGTLLPAFARVLRSPVWGAAVTSLLFATIHPTGIPAWPGLAAIGAMSCVLAYHTRSLVPSIVMHGVHNAITLCAALAFGT